MVHFLKFYCILHFLSKSIVIGSSGNALWIKTLQRDTLLLFAASEEGQEEFVVKYFYSVAVKNF